jgi:hypothetical protein
MGVQPVYCKGPHTTLWVGSRASRGTGGDNSKWCTKPPKLLRNVYGTLLFGTVAVVRDLETHVIGVKGTWRGIPVIANPPTDTAVAVLCHLH